jgi:anthranilate phosphoribosyltransferase
MAERLLDTGFAFLYAPSYHPAMKHVGPIRRELGFRTLFNLVGPLANPARATHQVVGVYEQGLVWIVADALLQLGVEKALVVHGHGGMDELTLSGPSHAVRVSGGRLDPLVIDPAPLGFVPAGPELLAGGTAMDNAALIEELLQGRASKPVMHIVLLNASAALSLVHDLPLKDCLELARESLTSGNALAVLEAHRAFQEGTHQ